MLTVCAHHSDFLLLLPAAPPNPDAHPSFRDLVTRAQAEAGRGLRTSTGTTTSLAWMGALLRLAVGWGAWPTGAPTDRQTELGSAGVPVTRFYRVWCRAPVLRPRAGMSEATPAKTQRPRPTHRLAGRGPASAPAPFPPFAHPPTLPRPARGRAGLRGAPAATRARARAIVLSDRPHAFRWRDFSRRKTRADGHPIGVFFIRVYFSHRGIHLKPGLDST